MPWTINGNTKERRTEHMKQTRRQPLTRRSHGRVTHVICGWVAAPVNKTWNVRRVECVGESQIGNSIYYDIALDGHICLHIYRWTPTDRAREFEPYIYTGDYPL